MSNFKAILIGINNYGGGNDLNGCVNDVLYMREILLTKYRVESTDIRTITDQSATTEAILERLTWLVEQGNSYKNLLFWYSGHGTQIPNTNYKDEEYDGMDELICPCDFDFRDKHITDDTIREIISKLNPKAKLSMVFDCCHSGTISREFLFSNPITFKNRYIAPPPDLMCRANDFQATSLVDRSSNIGFDSVNVFQEDLFWDIEDKSELEKPASMKKRSSLLNITQDKNIVVLSACMDHQTAADAYFFNRYQGAFSFAIQKNLMIDPSLPAGELHSRASNVVSRFGFEQKPVLAVDREVFRSQPFIMV